MEQFLLNLIWIWAYIIIGLLTSIVTLKYWKKKGFKESSEDIIKSLMLGITWPMALPIVIVIKLFDL